MAIVRQTMREKHRCTACGTKWWPEGKPEWWECSQPDQHPCPTCSAPKPKAEPVVECKGDHRRLPDEWDYCPHCGVALKAKEEG